MSLWTHHRNEMFGEVVNFLMLMLREKKNPFPPTQGWHVLGGQHQRRVVWAHWLADLSQRSLWESPRESD